MLGLLQHELKQAELAGPNKITLSNEIETVILSAIQR
jgi:hypothetical protein